MPYEVRLHEGAEKELRALPRHVQVRIAEKLRALGDEPRPEGVKKLKGLDDVYRVRVGDYRVLYSIDDGILLVLVIRIAHRREAY